jgi:flagellar hook assembly protein FlgD
MHNTKYAVQILGKALNLKWADVNRDDFSVPEAYTLSQNYPNPFNPTTNIHFSIAKPTDVRIDIYDMIGQHVSTLINTPMSAGKYNISWNGQDKNGSRVASGMYLYRMVAGNFAMTKKMLMIK